MAATYLIALLYAPYVLSYCVRCLGRRAQPQRDFKRSVKRWRGAKAKTARQTKAEVLWEAIRTTVLKTETDVSSSHLEELT